MSGVSASTQPATGQSNREEMPVLPPRIPQATSNGFEPFNGFGFGFNNQGFNPGGGPGFGGDFGRNPFMPPQGLPYWQPPIETNPMNFAPTQTMQPATMSQRRVGHAATPMDSQNWRNWVDMGRTGNPDNAVASNVGPLTGGQGPISTMNSPGMGGGFGGPGGYGLNNPFEQ